VRWVELLDDVDLGKFDFTDAANPSYREWRVPAALIRADQRTRHRDAVTDDELWDMGGEHLARLRRPQPPWYQAPPAG
jgi:hypothetical protein